MPETTASQSIWAAGITEPVSDITMSSPAAGIIGARFVAEGAQVTKGKVLVELDNRIEAFELRRRILARDLIEAELNRLRALSERNTISVSREELEKKQAEFEIAAVEVDLANEQLRRRHLTAPFDGIVAEFYLDPGEGCDVRQPVVRVVDTSRCYFVTNIEARAGHGLEVGQKSRVEVESGAEPMEIEGTIDFVSPVVDPSSGLLKVKVIFENPGQRIRPGVAGRMLVNP